ncbi:UbiA prenyltransferase [Chloroherpeton thalassium ATCC 35110]|uniref:UbiA prenyltransferase n=1 Tax=Chloroherpeton thalassium (strain ATCC 35110 / GB-78) TaxID=517418 RepID=B3QXR0_CHLT3|nr:geranylgeranylglycerol-phosphate geranylgeranyltransferase [Chloroherpeton thalassium]ACF14975.1 UbiA prenyltransferase [Chloroherpeton thalassium ATCC 35110]
MNRIKPFIEIVRPSNIVLFFMAISLGGIMVGGFDAFFHIKVYLAAISGTLIGGAGNVINDIQDVEIDKINKPNRPLITGALSINAAKWFWVWLNLVGFLLAWLISKEAVAIAGASILILFVYSLFFKRQVLIGNLVVCTIISLAFVYGAMAYGKLEGIVFPIIFSFLFNFGREVLKDLEDVEGDKSAGARTLAIQLGTKKTLSLVSTVYVVLIGLSIWPYLTGEYGLLYVISIMLFTNTIVLYVVVRSWREQTKQNFYKMNTILKIAMLTGILSIAVGKISLLE